MLCYGPWITPVEKGDFINGNIKLKYGQIKVNVPSKSRKIILGICLPCKRGCLGHKMEFSQTAFRVKIENVGEGAAEEAVLIHGKPHKWPLAYKASIILNQTVYEESCFTFNDMPFISYTVSGPIERHSWLQRLLEWNATFL